MIEHLRTLSKKIDTNKKSLQGLEGMPGAKDIEAELLKNRKSFWGRILAAAGLTSAVVGLGIAGASVMKSRSSEDLNSKPTADAQVKPSNRAGPKNERHGDNEFILKSNGRMQELLAYKFGVKSGDTTSHDATNKAVSEVMRDKGNMDLIHSTDSYYGYLKDVKQNDIDQAIMSKVTKYLLDNGINHVKQITLDMVSNMGPHHFLIDLAPKKAKTKDAAPETRAEWLNRNNLFDYEKQKATLHIPTSTEGNLEIVKFSLVLSLLETKMDRDPESVTEEEKGKLAQAIHEFVFNSDNVLNALKVIPKGPGKNVFTANQMDQALEAIEYGEERVNLLANTILISIPYKVSQGHEKEKEKERITGEVSSKAYLAVKALLLLGDTDFRNIKTDLEKIVANPGKYIKVNSDL
ncbi:MAG: hypothetical protein AAB373_06210 [Patescibacteria group bacterium]